MKKSTTECHKPVINVGKCLCIFHCIKRHIVENWSCSPWRMRVGIMGATWIKSCRPGVGRGWEEVVPSIWWQGYKIVERMALFNSTPGLEPVCAVQKAARERRVEGWEARFGEARKEHQHQTPRQHSLNNAVSGHAERIYVFCHVRHVNMGGLCSVRGQYSAVNR